MGQACLASVVATAASRQPAKQLAHNVNILQLPPFSLALGFGAQLHRGRWQAHA